MLIKIYFVYLIPCNNFENDKKKIILKKYRKKCFKHKKIKLVASHCSRTISLLFIIFIFNGTCNHHRFCSLSLIDFDDFFRRYIFCEYHSAFSFTFVFDSSPFFAFLFIIFSEIAKSRELKIVCEME